MGTLSSCVTLRTPVGDFTESDMDDATEFDSSKQFYLLGIRLGHKHANVPEGPCLIESKFTFGDYLLTGITEGILSARTVRVWVKDSWLAAESEK